MSAAGTMGSRGFWLRTRAMLIKEQLPKVSARPLVFGSPPPKAPLGSWTLLDAGTIIVAADAHRFPDDDAPEREDGDLRGAASDVDDHASLRFGDG